jgi:hypothetical protein
MKKKLKPSKYSPIIENLFEVIRRLEARIVALESRAMPWITYTGNTFHQCLICYQWYSNGSIHYCQSGAMKGGQIYGK